MADPLVLLAGGDERPAGRRAGPARAGPGAGRRASSPTRPPPDVTVAAFALSGRLFVAGLRLGGGPGAARSTGRSSTPGPTPTGRRLAYVRGADAAPGRARRHQPEPWPAMRIPRSRGGRPSSSPPRRWAGPAATGGRPTARPSWPPGSTVAGARWWIADPAPARASAGRGRLPGGRYGQRRGLALGARPRRPRQEISWDRERAPLPGRRAWPEPERIVLTVQSRDQRHVEVLAADPATGATTALFEDERRRLGRAGARRAGCAGRRPGRDGSGPRGRPPPVTVERCR